MEYAHACMKTCVYACVCVCVRVCVCMYLFDRGCLSEINKFVKQLMYTHTEQYSVYGCANSITDRLDHNKLYVYALSLMYVCIYVCVYVCMYELTYYVYALSLTHSLSCTYAHIYIYIYTHTMYLSGANSITDALNRNKLYAYVSLYESLTSVESKYL